MSFSGAKRLKDFEIENNQLTKLLADSPLESKVTREVFRDIGDRTSPTRGGAGDGHARLRRAPCVESRRDERIGIAVHAAGRLTCRELNEQRPKKTLGGPTPTLYARKLTSKRRLVTA